MSHPVLIPVAQIDSMTVLLERMVTARALTGFCGRETSL